MLGIDSEFSISVSHALEMWNSSFPSESTIFWLRSVTSRVVMPSRKRSSFSCSPARKIDLVSAMLLADHERNSTRHAAKDYVILPGLQASAGINHGRSRHKEPGISQVAISAVVSRCRVVRVRVRGYRLFLFSVPYQTAS